MNSYSQHISEPSIEELISAFNDIESADQLMKKYNLSKQDLMAKAELVSKKLAEECTHMNIV